MIIEIILWLVWPRKMCYIAYRLVIRKAIFVPKAVKLQPLYFTIGLVLARWWAVPGVYIVHEVLPIVFSFYTD